MRHACVATTEKFYVGIQADETAAMLAGLMPPELPKMVVEVVLNENGVPDFSETPSFSVLPEGLEPSTYGLRVSCSTN